MNTFGKSKYFFAILLTLIGFLVGVSEVLAAVGVCCVYYDNSKTDKCSVYNGKTGALIDIKDNTYDDPSEQDAEDTFDCSKYDKANSLVKDLKASGSDLFDFTVNPSQIVERENFAGGYYGEIPLSSNMSATAANTCFDASGYKADLLTNLSANVEGWFGKTVQTGITKYDLCKYAGLKLSTDLKLKAALDGGAAKEADKMEAVKKEYQGLKDFVAKICCVPRKKLPDSQCIPPTIKSEVTDAVETYLGLPKSNPFPKQLSSFASLTPNTSKPEDHNLAMYFTCEGAGGAAWESAYFLSGMSCKAIASMDLNTNFFLDYGDGFTSCKQQKYYCLCKKDHSECENKTYQYLDKTLDNTTMPQGCNFDLAGKTGKDGEGSWICEYTSAPAEMKLGEYCAHLAMPKIGKEDYDPFPFELAAIQEMGRKLKKTSANTVQDLVGKAIKAVMQILGSIALGMFVYGGFMVMSSAGSSEKTEKGTQILVWSALGVIIILSAYMLVKFVLEIIG